MRWEYDMLSLTDFESEQAGLEVMNSKGSRGWELVTITTNGTALFKRPLPDPLPGEDGGPIVLTEELPTWVDQSEHCDRPVANN